MRDGTEVGRIPRKAQLKDAAKRKVVEEVVGLIVVRTRYDRFVAFRDLRPCGCGDPRCPVFLIEARAAEVMDDLRERILHEFGKVAPGVRRLRRRVVTAAPRGDQMARICNDDHSIMLPVEFNQLPGSQAARWRHICAGSAYELGRRHTAEAEERLRQRVRDLTAKVKDRSGAPRVDLGAGPVGWRLSGAGTPARAWRRSRAR